MSFGRPYILKVDGCIHDGWLVIGEVERTFVPDYLYYLLSSTWAYQAMSNLANGAIVQNLKSDTVKHVNLPLPPLAEQHRIVAAIESALAVIDEIERNKSDLATAVAAAKSKILSLAIRGKLVPQNPDDEPASVLLERIRAERETLESAGKIKRDKGKNAAAASVDNSYYLNIEGEPPFILPESWAWVRFGGICEYGACNSVAAERIGNDAWILDLEDIEKDTAKIVRFTSKRERPFTSSKHVFAKGQVLFSKLRPYLKKVIVTPESGYCTSEILPLSFNIDICPEYMRVYLSSEYFVAYANQYACGAKMPRLGAKDAENAPLPLPPLAEQRRIVVATEAAFEYLNGITATLA
jgi:type I restriction enzyme S subunit